MELCQSQGTSYSTMTGIQLIDQLGVDITVTSAVACALRWQKNWGKSLSCNITLLYISMSVTIAGKIYIVLPVDVRIKIQITLIFQNTVVEDAL